MDKYHHVAKEVEPKRIALKESQEELDVLTQKLNKLRSELKVNPNPNPNPSPNPT